MTQAWVSTASTSHVEPRQMGPDQEERSDHKLGSWSCLLITPAGQGAARWATDAARGGETH